MMFFPGLHIPSHARHFERCMVSVNRLRERRSGFGARDWIMDSGAFTEVTTHGGFREPVQAYAEQINRWSVDGAQLLAAVAQDFMCEPFALAKTGATVELHQEWTVERYDELLALRPAAYVIPVLQGWDPPDYAAHVRMYGSRLRAGAWVGVGSVCKRNTRPGDIEGVLHAIHGIRRDLRLHAFGLKLTALGEATIRDRLWSADSMAWSWAARRQGRNANDWREAARFVRRVETTDVQTGLFGCIRL
jgi:hypothetical protein